MVLCKRGVVAKTGKIRKFDMKSNVLAHIQSIYVCRLHINNYIYTLQKQYLHIGEDIDVSNKCTSLCPTQYRMIYEKVSCK